ncbi:MAG: FKBP-type peptidyl-prolyl cis-trans isomerase N-terminal domain-containing protein, partial [Pseudomonadota bacterium]
MRKPLTAILLAGTVMFPAILPAQAQDLAKPEGTKEIVSYAFGMQLLRNLGELGVAEDVDLNLVVQALTDRIAGNEPRITMEEGQAAFQELSTVIQARALEEAEKAAAENLAAGAAFLAENGAKDGITTTESGLQYRVITAVEGGGSPTLENTVVAHYTGTLLDGTKFDSSRDRGSPASFPVTGVIKGWTEVLQLMKVGETYEVWIPADLAYGERGA